MFGSAWVQANCWLFTLCTFMQNEGVEGLATRNELAKRRGLQNENKGRAHLVRLVPSPEGMCCPKQACHVGFCFRSTLDRLQHQDNRACCGQPRGVAPRQTMSPRVSPLALNLYAKEGLLVRFTTSLIDKSTRTTRMLNVPCVNCRMPTSNVLALPPLPCDGRWPSV